MATVVCDREGCFNQGIKMNLLVDPNTETQSVICGPCGLPVTRVIIPAIDPDAPREPEPGPTAPKEYFSALVDAQGNPITIGQLAEGGMESAAVPAGEVAEPEEAPAETAEAPDYVPSVEDNAGLVLTAPTPEPEEGDEPVDEAVDSGSESSSSDTPS